MCLCEKIFITLVFCAVCCTNIVQSIPNAWPKMRNYDIWGGKSTKYEPADDINNYSIENTSNLTSSRDGRGKSITLKLN